jgi:hypothetical protein
VGTARRLPEVVRSENKSNYNYLTTMPLRSLTEARVKHLMKEAEKKQEEFELLRSKQPVQLWMDDLAALKAHIEVDLRFAR